VAVEAGGKGGNQNEEEFDGSFHVVVLIWVEVDGQSTAALLGQGGFGVHGFG
jgi:hypothetical protein